MPDLPITPATILEGVHVSVAETKNLHMGLNLLAGEVIGDALKTIRTALDIGDDPIAKLQLIVAEATEALERVVQYRQLDQRFQHLNPASLREQSQRRDDRGPAKDAGIAEGPAI